MSIENNIDNLRKEEKICQKEILELLLKVSQSFNNPKMGKEDRDLMFIKIDSLREKIKDINNTIRTQNFNSLEETLNVSNKGSKEDNYVETVETSDIQDIEEIDRLIDEAQELNNDVIKFPVAEKLDEKKVELVEEGNKEEVDNNKILKFNSTIDEEMDLEPVPVLFGRNEANNQMILRHRETNNLTDKIKTLFFRIKEAMRKE